MVINPRIFDIIERTKGDNFMDEITYDKVEEENNPRVKQLYWDIAFGLQVVDGLKPSKYMKELSIKHINWKKLINKFKTE